MLRKNFFMVSVLVFLLILSLVVVKERLTAAVPQANPQDEILDKLDKLIAGQEKIMERLGTMEEEIIHVVKVRATH